MEIVTEKISTRDNRPIYYHRDLPDVSFGRIAIGLAPPAGHYPGFCVVLGEEYGIDQILNLYHIHLLAESEHRGLSQLFKSAAELSEIYHAEDIYSRLDDGQRLYLSRWNDDNRKIAPHGLYIQETVTAEARGLSFYLQILRDRLDATRKSLHMGGDSRVAGALLELATDTAKPEENPAVSALAYAVAALTIWGPVNGVDLPTSYLGDSDKLDLGI